MPVAFGTTSVTAIYHGSTLIADLRHGTTQVPISSTTAPDAPTGVGVTVSDYSVSDAPTGVGVTVSEDPVAATDPYWQETVLLLQESLADESSFGQTLVNNGSVSLTSANAKTGTYGLDFSGGARWLEGTVDAATNMDSDCTIEAWIKTSAQSNQRIFQYRRSSTSATDLCSLHTNSGQLVFRIGAYLIQGTTHIDDGNWHHIAGVRTSTSLDIYVDGSLEGTLSIPSTYVLNSVGLPFTIGRDRFYTDYFDGQLDNFRFSRVARYTSAFTPPAASFPTAEPVDEFFGDTVLLIQENLEDESLQGQTLTWGSGVTKTSTSKVGNYAISISGNGTAARTVLPTDASLNFGTGDFTIEGWFKCGSMDTYGQFLSNTFSTSNNSSAVTNLAIGSPYLSGRVRFASNDIANNTLTGTTAVNDNQWHHIAAVRSGSTMMLFVDGGLDGTLTTANEFSISGGHIGDSTGIYANNADNEWTGLFDGLRITKGVARYTAAFTPSGKPLPRSNGDPEFANVVLLVQDSFADESLNGLTVVNNGSTLDTSGQQYGSAAFSFPNTGNVQVANDPALHLSGDFTIECWAYIVNTNQNPCLVAKDTLGGRAWVLQHINSTGTMAFSIVNTGSYYFSNTTPTPTNQWFHVAACRQGSTLYTSIDGVVTSQTVGAGMPNVATPVWIGRQGSWGNQLNGKVDSLRITKGIARYTSNFTPPAQEFPN